MGFHNKLRWENGILPPLSEPSSWLIDERRDLNNVHRDKSTALFILDTENMLSGNDEIDCCIKSRFTSFNICKQPLSIHQAVTE